MMSLPPIPLAVLLAVWVLSPLVLLVEDLHWCDASSLELLGRIIAQGTPSELKGEVKETILALTPDNLDGALDLIKKLPQVAEAAVFGDGLHIATTRPETMLGDTAVAVNPDDERYQGITATAVILPLVNREIPIIRDAYVDMSFGTGGLKVTPAHDPNDFEIGRRHNLPSVKAIGDDGLMTEEAGRFAGLDRFECRKTVVQELQETGQLEKIEPYCHSVGHCYRCHTIVEPRLSPQWFVKMKPLAIPAIASGALASSLAARVASLPRSSRPLTAGISVGAGMNSMTASSIACTSAQFLATSNRAPGMLFDSMEPWN